MKIAQADISQFERTLLPKFAGKKLGDIINEIVPLLFTIAGLVLLLYLLWGGFSLMLSRGDPKATEAAKEKITNAIIGFVIIFLAFWLVQLFGFIFGVKQFGEIF